MPIKFKDTLEKVRKLENEENSQLLLEFYDYLSKTRTSENIILVTKNRNINIVLVIKQIGYGLLSDLYSKNYLVSIVF